MKLDKKHEIALQEVADAHFALQQRLNEIVFLEGAKLFEPIKDMSLDPGDIVKIENQLFKLLEQYPEFNGYLDARKKALPAMLDLMTKMKKAKKDDWKQLVETELGLEISKGVRLMASKMGISYGSKVYIQ
ncbi:hypothetical protein GF342_00415 [Candidatus Woesearchaeota archaeon]|nr:hypothetical protein [Candidatus Woesearchaeota archaeon]